MDCLPNDIISPILSCLEVDDICRCGCVAKAWASAIHFDPITTRVLAQKPMAIAERIGNERIMTLLAKGMDATCEEKNWKSYNPLHFAALSGSLQLVDALLENGVPVDGKTSRGETPLHLAAMKGHEAVAKKLISRGCVIDPRDCNMKTPLMLAAHQGHTGLLIDLISQGADSNAQDKCSNTALILAAWYGRSSIVEALIATGANINIRGQNRKSAVERAKDLHHHGVVCILRRAGARHDSPVENLAAKQQKSAGRYLGRLVTVTLLWIIQFLHV